MVMKIRDLSLDGRANPEIAELFQHITGCEAEVTSGQTFKQKTVTVMGDSNSILSSLKVAVDERRRAPRSHRGTSG